MYRIYLTAFLFLLISPVWGLTDAPTLLKACMNVNDSVVTILYRTPTDVCGSFQEYHVYEHQVQKNKDFEDISGIF